MGFMKHVCQSSTDVIDFIIEITQEGYVVDKLESIEFDHYLVTYHNGYRKEK